MRTLITSVIYCVFLYHGKQLIALFGLIKRTLTLKTTDSLEYK
jgi:hypothetical protein